MDGRRPSFKTGLVGHGLEELYRLRILSGAFTRHRSLPVSRNQVRRLFQLSAFMLQSFPEVLNMRQFLIQRLPVILLGNGVPNHFDFIDQHRAGGVA